MDSYKYTVITMPKKTPSEIFIERGMKELEKQHRMQKELDKYGSKTPTGGKVWTVGDMQSFFKDSKKRRK